jgi:uncharacterized protein YecE (DUF72 family)
VRKADALSYYAGQFDTTELNAPFYRTPSLDAVRNWFDLTPDEFRFAWKASRFITHYKRLSQRCDTSLDLMWTRLSLLRHKLGPVLFQLPPNMKIDGARLGDFIAMLDKRARYSFEFRHPSWYDDGIYDLLRDHDIALCLSDHTAAPAPCVVTASWVYVRLHGSDGRYAGNYSDEALSRWARAARSWSRQARDVWCFFDNDVKSAAPNDARRLTELCRPKQATARLRHAAVA